MLVARAVLALALLAGCASAFAPLTRQFVRAGPLRAGFALVPSSGSNKDVSGGEQQQQQATNALARKKEPTSQCPCGSGATYGDCCLPYHTLAQKALDPVALIRSRYSAYSLENVDYVVDTTSATSPDYLAYVESPVGARSGRKKWIKDVRKNMVDSFSYVHMEVDKVETSPEGDEASVFYRHLAISKVENTMYPIEERAYCVKDTASGAWYFEAATVQRPEADLSQKMMEEFPIKAGLKLVGGRVVPLSSSGEEGDGDGEEGAAEAGATAAAGAAAQVRPPRAPRPRRAPPKAPGLAAPPQVRAGKK